MAMRAFVLLDIFWIAVLLAGAAWLYHEGADRAEGSDEPAAATRRIDDGSPQATDRARESG